MIFATMLLPMSLAQFASCSQDALLLSAGAARRPAVPADVRRRPRRAEYLGPPSVALRPCRVRPTWSSSCRSSASVAPRLTGRFSALTVVGGGGRGDAAWIVWVAIYVQVPQPHSGIVPMMGDQLRT
ncbi:hypothetical protein [Azospirillum argentinense]|uniref:hypothetical protein n=1 Tax=Azospirillum argentinense TaxID=2970906 RepID=UPI0010BFA9E5|nr:hypothetical protein [Azospirillum argentinense]